MTSDLRPDTSSVLPRLHLGLVAPIISPCSRHAWRMPQPLLVSCPGLIKCASSPRPSSATKSGVTIRSHRSHPGAIKPTLSATGFVDDPRRTTLACDVAPCSSHVPPLLPGPSRRHLFELSMPCVILRPTRSRLAVNVHRSPRVSLESCTTTVHTPTPFPVTSSVRAPPSLVENGAGPPSARLGVSHATQYTRGDSGLRPHDPSETRNLRAGDIKSVACRTTIFLREEACPSLRACAPSPSTPRLQAIFWHLGRECTILFAEGLLGPLYLVCLSTDRRHGILIPAGRLIPATLLGA